MTNPVNERKVRCIFRLRRGPISYVSWWKRGTRTSMVRALHVAYWYGSPNRINGRIGMREIGSFDSRATYGNSGGASNQYRRQASAERGSASTRRIRNSGWASFQPSHARYGLSGMTAEDTFKGRLVFL